MPVYLYWGEEEYNLENAVRDLKNKVLDPEWALLNHKVLNEPDVQHLIEALQTMPMVFGNILFEITTSNLFLRGGKKGTDEQNKKLIDILENINSNVHVLFICPIPRDTGRKIDSSTKLVKAIDKVGEIKAFEAFKFYQEKEIIDWITKKVVSFKCKIAHDAAQALFANTGTELRRLSTEIEKLATSIKPEKMITKQHVLNLCSTHENIFLLADHLLNNEKSKAIIELHKLLEKDHPLRIIATLNTQVKKWIRIKLEARSKDAFEVSKIVNLHKFIVEKELQKLKNVSVEYLLGLRNRLAEAEFKIKSGEMEPELSLEMAISL